MKDCKASWAALLSRPCVVCLRELTDEIKASHCGCLLHKDCDANWLGCPCGDTISKRLPPFRIYANSQDVVLGYLESLASDPEEQEGGFDPDFLGENQIPNNGPVEEDKSLATVSATAEELKAKLELQMAKIRADSKKRKELDVEYMEGYNSYRKIAAQRGSMSKTYEQERQRHRQMRSELAILAREADGHPLRDEYLRLMLNKEIVSGLETPTRFREIIAKETIDQFSKSAQRGREMEIFQNGVVKARAELHRLLSTNAKIRRQIDSQGICLQNLDGHHQAKQRDRQALQDQCSKLGEQVSRMKILLQERERGPPRTFLPPASRALLQAPAPLVEPRAGGRERRRNGAQGGLGLEDGKGHEGEEPSHPKPPLPGFSSSFPSRSSLPPSSAPQRSILDEDSRRVMESLRRDARPDEDEEDLEGTSAIISRLENEPVGLRRASSFSSAAASQAAAAAFPSDRNPKVPRPSQSSAIERLIRQNEQERGPAARFRAPPGLNLGSQRKRGIPSSSAPQPSSGSPAPHSVGTSGLLERLREEGRKRQLPVGGETELAMERCFRRLERSAEEYEPGPVPQSFLGDPSLQLPRKRGSSGSLSAIPNKKLKQASFSFLN